MRHLLRMLRARTLADTVAAVALVRPGPAESGMKEAFCRRRRGLEPVTTRTSGCARRSRRPRASCSTKRT
jgi:DNA polymerase III alpha subunit